MGDKKKELAGAHRDLADLAGFYGPQVCGLAGLGPNESLAVLAASMPRLKAAKRMETEDLGKLHPDDLYDLVLEATGSESLASAYRVNRIKADWKQK